MLGKLFNKEKPNYGLLDDMINKPGIPGEYSYQGPSNARAFNDQVFYREGSPMPMYDARGVYEVPTDDGNRYYFGQDQAFDRNTAKQLTRADALIRSQMYPADSISTEEFNKFKGYSLFPKKW